MKWKGESIKIGFYLVNEKIKEGNLEVLHANMNIVIAGLDVCFVFEWKGNLTDTTECNTGETGDIN